LEKLQLIIKIPLKIWAALIGTISLGLMPTAYYFEIKMEIALFITCFIFFSLFGVCLWFYAAWANEKDKERAAEDKRQERDVDLRKESVERSGTGDKTMVRRKSKG
jgi:hypothetical protein|tara:strand:+ start:210 stop:527 length:318 start_codon:yes stop_codon:yes gene_type:complete